MDCGDLCVLFGFSIMTSNAVKWIAQHLRQQSRWTNTLYGIISWMHTFIAHSFHSSLSAPSELNSRSQTTGESCGVGTHSISSKWNHSHFSVYASLSFFSFFSFSVPILLPFTGLNLPRIYITFFLTHSVFFTSACRLLSVDQVLPSASPFGANKMTRCFLINSALSNSSNIILLVSTM